jgi:AcrR family transcriptional regulator
VTSRTRTPSNEIAHAVVDAAVRLLEAEGPDALTVRGIAAEAGVAPMAVYNHFGGKDGVVDRVFVRGFDRLRSLFADIDGDDPREDLFTAGRRYRRNALDHPAMYAVMFDRAVPGFEPSDDARLHALASFEELVRLVRRAMDLGVLREGDAVDAAQQIWSACHGQVSLELRGIGFTDDLDAHHEALMHSMFEGLGARDREAGPGRPGRLRGG